MLFAIVLGTVLGAAGVTLLRQWAAGTFNSERDTHTTTAYPRLTPRRSAPARRLAQQGLHLRRAA